ERDGRVRVLASARADDDRTPPNALQRIDHGAHAAILSLLAFAMLIVSLDQYVVVVALPTIARALGYSQRTLQAGVGAYGGGAGGEGRRGGGVGRFAAAGRPGFWLARAPAGSGVGSRAVCGRLARRRPGAGSRGTAGRSRGSGVGGRVGVSRHACADQHHV